VSTLWILPVLILAVGAVAIAAAVRQTADAVSELRTGLHAFLEVQQDVAGVRAELAAARQQAAGLRVRRDVTGGGKYPPRA
jgi:hypothetical protein